MVETKLGQSHNDHVNSWCIACPLPTILRDPEDKSKDGIGWQMFACFDGNYGLKRMSCVKDIDNQLKVSKTFFALDDDFDAFNVEHGRSGRQLRSSHDDCSEHFKAAQNSSKTKDQVDITGVFAMICARHGWAYKGLNFRGTGERMVYGLKILDWLTDEWSPDEIKILYDINCVFKKFVEVSQSFFPPV
jgi:hypothetical protein